MSKKKPDPAPDADAVAVPKAYSLEPTASPSEPAASPLPCVTEHSAACPRCKGLRHRVTNTTPFPGRTMAMADGTIRRGIRIQRRVCADCKRAFNVRLPLVENPSDPSDPADPSDPSVAPEDA